LGLDSPAMIEFDSRFCHYCSCWLHPCHLVLWACDWVECRLAVQELRSHQGTYSGPSELSCYLCRWGWNEILVPQSSRLEHYSFLPEIKLNLVVWINSRQETSSIVCQESWLPCSVAYHLFGTPTCLGLKGFVVVVSIAVNRATLLLGRSIQDAQSSISYVLIPLTENFNFTLSSLFHRECSCYHMDSAAAGMNLVLCQKLVSFR